MQMLARKPSDDKSWIHNVHISLLSNLLTVEKNYPVPFMKELVQRLISCCSV